MKAENIRYAAILMRSHTAPDTIVVAVPQKVQRKNQMTEGLFARIPAFG
jgi:hypothetical protein